MTPETNAETLYKASGILVFTELKGELHVLLFREQREDGTFWIDIGGRRERIDTSSWETATRELSEELPNLCTVKPEEIMNSIWIPDCKYVLYCIYKEITDVHMDTKVRWFPLRKVLTRPRQLCRIQLHVRLRNILGALA